jgi:hypothetical protein
MNIAHGAWVALSAAFALAGCSVVDQFSGRIYGENLQAQQMMNEEALVNLVRASRTESLSFVGISQISGTRSEDLKVGLPTFTFGPKQTVGQHQFAFSGNILDSSTNGSFQSNPLITTTFQQGMLTPISPHTLALLVAAHGREPMFLATVAAFELKGQLHSHSFRNDPYGDRPPSRSEPCLLKNYTPSPSQTYTDATYVDTTIILITEGATPDDRICNFTKFKALLKAFLYAGLFVDIPEKKGGDRASQETTLAVATSREHTTAAMSVPAASGAGGGGGSGGGNSGGSPPGQICLDRGFLDASLTKREENRAAFWAKFPTCGDTAEARSNGLTGFTGPEDKQQGKECADGTDSTVGMSPKDRKDSDDAKRHKKPKECDTGSQFISISAKLRSPIAVYNYLGQIMSLEVGRPDDAEPVISYVSFDASERLKTVDGRAPRFLNIVTDGDMKNCGTAIEYSGHAYCAKDEGSTSTMLALLQDLRNLSINSTDLNSALTVHVQ